ncbi:hypothetical protein F25303_3299 [Fusarium sp. NRRL 25303]|nr:hypothetical protein F25303_3299 [Fusarium sp. NRRL 25303]
MGCSLSKNPGTESQNDNTPPNVPAPGVRPSFPQPYQDHLVIKGGPGVAESEAENMKFALETLGLPIPKVHHAFTAEILDDPDLPETALVEAHFIVIDYIKGSMVDKSWQSLDTTAKETVAQQVVDVIDKMQSTILNHMPVGPIERSQDAKFQGPWFTDYGAGPFNTLGELEDWCNHKIDVGIMVKQLKPETPRFEFKGIVLTHQDLALRNLILDKDMKVSVQAENNECADMVLERLSERQDTMIAQYRKIAYGLSSGRALRDGIKNEIDVSTTYG